MTINLAVLDAAIAEIEANPDGWDQTEWYRDAQCGTTCCLAGNIVFRAGATKAFPTPSDLCLTPAGNTIEIPTYAATLLGISDRVADALFSASNTLDDLKAMRDILAAGGGVDELEAYVCHVTPYWVCSEGCVHCSADGAA